MARGAASRSHRVVGAARALAADPGLVAELNALRRVDEALGVLPGAAAPEELAGRVLAAAGSPRRRWLRVWIPLAAAAAAALLAVGLLDRAPAAPPDPFSIEEHLGYVWEADTETFGSLRLEDLEDRILAELERG